MVQVDKYRSPVRSWIAGGRPGSGMGGRLRPAAGAWCRFRFTRRPGYEPARRLTFRSQAGKDAVRSCHLLTGQVRGDLDRLLAHDAGLGMTRLTWLTTPAVEATSAAVKTAIEKLLFLRRMDAHHLDLSMLPRERRRFLATLGRRSTAPGLERRGKRRYPVLLALVAQSAVDQLDEVIALFDLAVSARESRAKARTEEALANRARKGEARQLLMDVILPVLIDVGVPDENVGEILRTRIGMDKLCEVAAVNWQRLPRDHGRLAALEASHSYLGQFSPHVLNAIDFQGGPGTGDLIRDGLGRGPVDGATTALPTAGSANGP